MVTVENPIQFENLLLESSSNYKPNKQRVIELFPFFFKQFANKRAKKLKWVVREVTLFSNFYIKHIIMLVQFPSIFVVGFISNI